MPEKVTNEALAERLKGVDQMALQRHETLEKCVEDLEGDFKTLDQRVDGLELLMTQKFGDMETARVEGERRILTENEKNRISRNRWVIGTMGTGAIAAIGWVIDLLKG